MGISPLFVLLGCQGRDSSSMVLSTSTKGTSAMTTLNRSGRRLTTAPISSPPALPRIPSSEGDVSPCTSKFSAQATKSLKLFFCSSSAHLHTIAHPARFPTDLGNAVDIPPVHQTENVHPERGVSTVSIGAIPFQQGGVASVALQRFL